MDRCLSLCLPNQKLNLCTLRLACWVQMECAIVLHPDYCDMDMGYMVHLKNIKQSTIQLAAVMTSTGGYTILIPGPGSEANEVKLMIFLSKRMINSCENDCLCGNRLGHCAPKDCRRKNRFHKNASSCLLLLRYSSLLFYLNLARWLEGASPTAPPYPSSLPPSPFPPSPPFPLSPSPTFPPLPPPPRPAPPAPLPSPLSLPRPPLPPPLPTPPSPLLWGQVPSCFTIQMRNASFTGSSASMPREFKDRMLPLLDDRITLKISLNERTAKVCCEGGKDDVTIRRRTADRSWADRSWADAALWYLDEQQWPFEHTESDLNSIRKAANSDAVPRSSHSCSELLMG